METINFIKTIEISKFAIKNTPPEFISGGVFGGEPNIINRFFFQIRREFFLKMLLNQDL